MDTVFVTMIDSVGEKAKGEVYEIDAETAAKWVAAGLATIVDNPTDKSLAKFEKALEERDNRLVESISKSLKAVNVKVPAVAKDHSNDESYLVTVGKTAHSNPDVRAKAYARLKGNIASQYETTSYGGYLVPTEQANELLKVDGFNDEVYSRLKIRPMGKSLTLPALDQSVTPSAGSSAFYAGCSIGVVAEGNAPSNTGMAFAQVALTSKKVLATVQVSQELLDDSPISVEGLVKDCFQSAATSWIGWNVFNGGGTSTTLTGIVDHAATISVPRSTASDIKLADLAKMYSRLVPSSAKNAVWFVNPLAMEKFPLLGNSNHLVWINDGVNGKPVMTFLGLPIVPCEALPAVGSAGDVVLADLRYFAFGMGQDIVVDASPHIGFTSDVITYRLRFRCDGKPQLTAPIYLQDASSTVSAFVQLDNLTS